MRNRRILLQRRPIGLLSPHDYSVTSEPLAEIAEGDALVKTELLAMDPVTRVMLAADIGIMPPVELGTAIRGFGAGTVVESRRGDLPVGARVSGFFEWADFQRAATDRRLERLPDDVSFTQALNLHGHTAHAAYFGMLDIGQVAAGDTVLVTGASGAVGSVAAQIARIMGARVIGTAGTAAKCAWLTDELMLAGAVNYHANDVRDQVIRLAPNGVDLLFDNVGGPLLDVLIATLAQDARVVLCGGVAQYLGDNPLAVNYDEPALAERAKSVRRFNAMDFGDRFAKAYADMSAWESGGKLKVATTFVDGLETAPAALNSLFEGKAHGRVIARVAGPNSDTR